MEQISVYRLLATVHDRVGRRTSPWTGEILSMSVPTVVPGERDHWDPASCTFTIRGWRWSDAPPTLSVGVREAGNARFEVSVVTEGDLPVALCYHDHRHFTRLVVKAIADEHGAAAASLLAKIAAPEFELAAVLAGATDKDADTYCKELICRRRVPSARVLAAVSDDFACANIEWIHVLDCAVASNLAVARGIPQGTWTQVWKESKIAPNGTRYGSGELRCADDTIESVANIMLRSPHCGGRLVRMTGPDVDDRYSIVVAMDDGCKVRLRRSRGRYHRWPATTYYSATNLTPMSAGAITDANRPEWARKLI